MNRKWVIAAILGMACLWGGMVKTFAVGTETVNGIIIKRISTDRVVGKSAVWWNGTDVGSTSAIFNSTGSTTAAANFNTSDCYDTRVIRISYASITGNGTPTFSIYGLSGTTSTGVLARVTSNISGTGVSNPWSPATTTGTSATFIINDYCEGVAVSLAVASGGTTTGVFVGGGFVNRLP